MDEGQDHYTGVKIRLSHLAKSTWVSAGDV